LTNKYPSDARALFLLCESVRQEQNSKLTLLGLYTGGELLVPLDTKLVTLQSLGILFIFYDGEGTFSPTLNLFAPSGAVIIKDAKVQAGTKESDGAIPWL
jgi:hypothetical protein